MPSWADIRTTARRKVHQTFAVPVLYYVRGSRVAFNDAANPLTARLQNKVQVAPDAIGGGYSQILEGVTRIVFNVEDLVALNLVPGKGDRVTFPDYGHTYQLENRDTPNGPINVKWSASFVGPRDFQPVLPPPP